jgi:hypothetical protein
MLEKDYYRIRFKVINRLHVLGSIGLLLTVLEIIKLFKGDKVS